MSLADKLAGKKVLVTGVTGFVGEALLHRIIGDLPDTTVVAIIRPKGSLKGTDRMAQMLKKDIFKPFYGEGTPYADADGADRRPGRGGRGRPVRRTGAAEGSRHRRALRR